MNSMTRLAFLIVFILMVTASIVFHKSHSASAGVPMVLEQLDESCIAGDYDLVQAFRDACDTLAEGCTASFIRPANRHDGLDPCSSCTSRGCWLCFGVDCPDE